MPIYEYNCPGCGTTFERRCSFSDADKAVKCPECKKPAKKKLSVFSAVSKGPGGGTMPISGAGSGCSSCAASSCSTCGS